MILRINRMHERVRPAHHLKRFVVFPNEISDNLDAMASHVNDSTTTRLFQIPEQSLWGPGCVSRERTHKILPSAPFFTDF